MTVSKSPLLPVSITPNDSAVKEYQVVLLGKLVCGTLASYPGGAQLFSSQHTCASETVFNNWQYVTSVYLMAIKGNSYNFFIHQELD